MINTTVISTEELTEHINTRRADLKNKRELIRKLEIDTYDLLDEIEELAQMLEHKQKGELNHANIN